MFSRTKEINLSPIKSIELIASRIPDAISLAQGIPSFDTPEMIKKAAIKALKRGAVAKYSLTNGLPELRETVEQKLAEEGMYYDFEKEIIITAGSIEAITAVLISIISAKKNEIILFSPSYASYAEAVRVSGGAPVFVNLTEEKGWQIDFKELNKKINSKTAAILICNPNNPTGTIFPKDDLMKIAQLAESKNFFILSDEVYKDFIYNNIYLPLNNESSNYFSLAQIPKLRKRIIRIFSLSKAYAMTGWRIGFLHSDEENVREILKVHDSLVTCAPVISQYAAMAALDWADDELNKFRHEFHERMELVCKMLDELDRFLSYQKPSGSYFIFPKISKSFINSSAGAFDRFSLSNHLNQDQQKSFSWKFAIELLIKAKVAVVPGIAFGPNGENHFRISFGREEKDIREAISRIGEFFNSIF